MFFNNLKIIHFTVKEKNSKLPERLPYKNMKTPFVSNFVFNSKIQALLGFNLQNQAKKFNFLLNKRENSVQALLIFKNKKFQLLKKLIYRRWSYLLNSKFYKALRFAKGLPIRGQRTHTNASTARKINSII